MLIVGGILLIANLALAFTERPAPPDERDFSNPAEMPIL
jgi:hypothetical protein